MAAVLNPLTVCRIWMMFLNHYVIFWADNQFGILLKSPTRGLAGNSIFEEKCLWSLIKMG
jgi:hypothetical protein